MAHLYVLELLNSTTGIRFYVGRTDDLDARLAQHFNGDGGEITGAHAAAGGDLRVVETMPTGRLGELEDAIVKRYMKDHGIDAVRGGSYGRRVLTAAQREVIGHEIRGAANLCYLCGSADHFSRECASRRAPNAGAGGGGGACFRCGRAGHFAAACYARTHVTGRILSDDDDADVDEDDADSDDDDDDDDDEDDEI